MVRKPLLPAAAMILCTIISLSSTSATKMATRSICPQTDRMLSCPISVKVMYVPFEK